jgi:hypothetical protein
MERQIVWARSSIGSEPTGYQEEDWINANLLWARDDMTY